MPYSIQEIRGAVARGWCDEPNRKKEMDSDLAEAITQQVWQMLHKPPMTEAERDHALNGQDRW